MRISDWSSDVCSSDLRRSHRDVSWRRRTRRDQPQGVESHELRAWRGARGGLSARQAGRPVQHARRAKRLRSEFSIPSAEPADVPVLLTLIRALAVYEKLEHEGIATEADLRTHLFGVRPYAEALIAECKGEAAGFALYFHNYSTFLAKPGLYLEDLFVQPAQRGKGIGKRLLAELAQIGRRQIGRAHV